VTARRKRPLGELLVLDVDPVDVIDTQEYRIAGVYGFGRGLFERGPIEGGETSYKSLNRLRTDRLVVSRLKAFEGALAVVRNEFDGWFLSPEFPTFRCIEDELNPRYLAHVCRWPVFWSMLAATSKGIGSRRERVHVKDVLSLELKVPGIDEQRRVADRLDRLHASAAELIRRSDHAAKLTGALAASATARPDLDDEAKARAGWRRVALQEVLRPSTGSVQIQPADQYLIAGIYSFGRGLIDRGAIVGADTSYKALTPLSVDDIVVSKLNGWEGAVAVVDERFDGYYVSSEYPTFKADERRLLPSFFDGIARSPRFWEALDSTAKGSMVRRRRINSAGFLSTSVWLPPLHEQARVAEELRIIDRSSQAREDIRARIEALLPAALNEAFAGLS